MPRVMSSAAAWVVSLALSLLTCPGARAALRGTVSSVQYHRVRSVSLGAPDKWDYAVYDSAGHRVYVAHGNRLSVVDGRTGRIVGQVGPIPGVPHGTAIDRRAGVGITDDGRFGRAIIFSLRSLRILARLKVERGADAVAFDPVSGHAFVVDGEMGSVAVIDPVRRKVLAFIHIGEDLEYGVAGDNGHLYVNGVTHREIVRIDTATNHVDAHWAMPTCRDPHGLAIDTETHRLFASCENRRLVVVDSNDGAVVATLPIGGGTDADRFDGSSRLIFSSNGADGTLSIIREVNADTYVPMPGAPTALSGRTMALDPASGRVFVVAAQVSPRSLKAYLAVWRAGKRARPSLFVPDSLRLLFFDPAH